MEMGHPKKQRVSISLHSSLAWITQHHHHIARPLKGHQLRWWNNHPRARESQLGKNFKCQEDLQTLMRSALINHDTYLQHYTLQIRTIFAPCIFAVSTKCMQLLKTHFDRLHLRWLCWWTGNRRPSHLCFCSPRGSFCLQKMVSQNSEKEYRWWIWKYSIEAKIWTHNIVDHADELFIVDVAISIHIRLLDHFLTIVANIDQSISWPYWQILSKIFWVREI